VHVGTWIHGVLQTMMFGVPRIRMRSK